MSDTKPMIDMLHRMNSAVGEHWFAYRDALIAGIEQQAEELAAANEARERAERERDEARENARVRSGEALDYYSAMLNLAHEFGAKDGDNMIEVIGNGIDALRAEVERLREALLHCARMAEALKRPCSDDPESAQAVRNGQYQNISTMAHIALGTIRGPAAIDAARKE